MISQLTADRSTTQLLRNKGQRMIEEALIKLRRTKEFDLYPSSRRCLDPVARSKEFVKRSSMNKETWNIY